MRKNNRKQREVETKRKTKFEIIYKKEQKIIDFRKHKFYNNIEIIKN